MPCQLAGKHAFFFGFRLWSYRWTPILHYIWVLCGDMYIRISKRKKSILSGIWLARVNVGLFYTVMFPATCETGLLLMGLFWHGNELFSKIEINRYDIL